MRGCAGSVSISGRDCGSVSACVRACMLAQVVYVFVCVIVGV